MDAEVREGVETMKPKKSVWKDLLSYGIEEVTMVRRYRVKARCPCGNVFEVLTDDNGDTMVPCPDCRKENTICIKDIRKFFEDSGDYE